MTQYGELCLESTTRLHFVAQNVILPSSLSLPKCLYILLRKLNIIFSSLSLPKCFDTLLHKLNFPSSLSLPQLSCDIEILSSPLRSVLVVLFFLYFVCMLCVTVGYCCLTWPGHWKRCLITMMIIIFNLPLFSPE